MLTGDYCSNMFQVDHVNPQIPKKEKAVNYRLTETQKIFQCRLWDMLCTGGIHPGDASKVSKEIIRYVPISESYFDSIKAQEYFLRKSSAYVERCWEKMMTILEEKHANIFEKCQHERWEENKEEFGIFLVEKGFSRRGAFSILSNLRYLNLYAKDTIATISDEEITRLRNAVPGIGDVGEKALYLLREYCKTV